MPQGIIRGYHSQNKAERKFGGTVKGGVFRETIGIELEVQAPSYSWPMNDDAHEVRNAFHANKFVYFEQDGTVDPGYEIITAPQTLYWFRDHMANYREALEGLAAKGYKSDQATCSCGLHVHVAVEAFGELESERDYNETKAVLIVEKFWSEIANLARRSSNWGAPIGLDANDPQRIERTVKTEKQYGSNHTRAVNLGNTHTVEFRFAKGTLNPDTFEATVELVVAIVNAANKLKVRDIVTCSTLREVLAKGNVGGLRPVLNDYMVRRGL
jgi:hypothetical protein